jgi:hypothetical protein
MTETIYALILFSIDCGIPCEAIEPAAGIPLTSAGQKGGQRCTVI